MAAANYLGWRPHHAEIMMKREKTRILSNRRKAKLKAKRRKQRARAGH
jgi:hypothetical protein